MEESWFLMSDCVIVLGCFRSGTSAIAGVLHHLGVFMGSKFDTPNDNNVSGYWEDIEFKEHHSNFDEQGDDPNAYAYIQIKSSYLSLIESREKDYQLWGLKDPALCKYLDVFVSCLKCTHRLIYCRRNIFDIKFSLNKSMKNKGVIDYDYSPLVDLYIEFLQEQLNNYKGPVLTLDHEETIKNPHKTVDDVSKFIGVNPTESAYKHIMPK